MGMIIEDGFPFIMQRKMDPCSALRYSLNYKNATLIGKAMKVYFIVIQIVAGKNVNWGLNLVSVVRFIVIYVFTL